MFGSCEKQLKMLMFTFSHFAVVKQRAAATLQSHQPGKHLPMDKTLSVLRSQRKSDPGITRSPTDHVFRRSGAKRRG